MNKGGQFYLMAAIAVILIIVGLAVVPNSLRKVGTDNSKIYELFVEVNIESKKMINYDRLENYKYDKESLEGYTKVELTNILRKMKETYPLIEKIHILIKKGSIDKRFYTYENGLISKSTETISLSSVMIDGTEYKFPSPSNSFYYLIIKEKNGHQYVVKG